MEAAANSQYPAHCMVEAEKVSTPDQAEVPGAAAVVMGPQRAEPLCGLQIWALDPPCPLWARLNRSAESRCCRREECHQVANRTIRAPGPVRGQAA